MSRVGIIGAGSWGTALSLVLANNGHSVEIWSIVESEIEMKSMSILISFLE